MVGIVEELPAKAEQVIGVKLFPSLSDDCIEQVVVGESFQLLFLGIPMGVYTVKDGGLYVAK